MICTKTCKKYTAFSVAATLLILGALLVSLWSTLIASILKSELTLSPTSTGFDLWKETPIPMYMWLYLYTWTNAKEVEQNWTIKPNFEERGPYVFSEHHQRVDLEWYPNDTIFYRTIRTWHFQPDMSEGKLDDKISNLNPIAATAANFVRDKNIIVRKAVDFVLREKEKDLVITKTAMEWMFEGYDDELLNLAKELKIPGLSTMDKFGWLYGRNLSKTYDGSYLMYTGVDDIEKLGIIEEWNNKSRTSYYQSYCGFVNGTSGELWPPLEKYNKIDVFTSDVCSTVSLFNSNVTKEVEGIEGKNFIGTDFNWDNGEKYPEQACFNNKVVRPTGVRDVSKCRFGAPAFVSYPHFYLADKIYTESIGGMKPDRKLHEFTLTAEPETGVPLEVDAKIQINLLLPKVPGIRMFEKVKENMLPMLWFRQTARLTKEYSGLIKLLLILPAVGVYTGYGFLALGGLIGLISVFISLRKGWGDGESEQLIESEKSPEIS